MVCQTSMKNKRNSKSIRISNLMLRSVTLTTSIPEKCRCKWLQWKTCSFLVIFWKHNEVYTSSISRTKFISIVIKNFSNIWHMELNKQNNIIRYDIGEKKDCSFSLSLTFKSQYGLRENDINILFSLSLTQSSVWILH